MAGLTAGGFEPETLEAIQARMEAKMDQFNPGFDLSVDSPDGQLLGIIQFELYQIWQQLNLVHNSYNPLITSGAGLRNIGLITGLPYGTANRSYSTVQLAGTAGTIIASGTLVANDAGDQFVLAFDTAIPSNAQVIAVVPGIVPVDILSNPITTIVAPVTGWDSVAQSADGVEGTTALSESQFKTLRQATVMRNSTSVVDVMQGRLLEAGVSQPLVLNNPATSGNLPDGTPPQTIHITIGDTGIVTDEEIGKVIIGSISMGCPTWVSGESGATSVVVEDNQGVSQTVNFTKAAEVKVKLNVAVTYLSDNIAGAEENIKASLLEYVNGLQSGEDVVWSRMFQFITPYAKAQVDTLEVAKLADSFGIVNIPIAGGEFATLDIADIAFVGT